MKQKISELIDIYEKGKKTRKPVFGKNRQRAELLKLNEIFLKELSGIKNRLGEKFFELIGKEFHAHALETPEAFSAYVDNLISPSVGNRKDIVNT